MTHHRPLVRRVAGLLPVLLTLGVATPPAVPSAAWPRAASRAAPSLVAKAEATPQGVKLALEGADWPAGATVTLTVHGRPDASDAADLGTVRIGRDGQLRATKRTPCTTRDPQRATGRVRISARDADSGATADAELPAAPWVCEDGRGA